MAITSYPQLFNDSNVVIQQRSNNGHHIGLYHSSSYVFGAANTNVYDALKCKAPFPRLHHVSPSASLQDADQLLDPSIDGENFADAGGRDCKVGEVIQGVDKREGRRAVQGAPIVEGGCDIDGRLVDIRNAKINFSHGCG